MTATLRPPCRATACNATRTVSRTAPPNVAHSVAIATLVAALLATSLSPRIAHAQAQLAQTPATPAAPPPQPAANQQPAAQSDEQLTRAYRREVTYLEAERRALTKELEAIERTAESQRAAVERTIADLQSRLITLTTQGDAADESDASASRLDDTIADDADLVASVLDQARSTFDLSASPATATAQNAAPVVLQLATAIKTRLREGAATRTLDATFFNLTGNAVEGRITHLGNVAAYGVAPNAVGALAPAGEQRLKLWPADAADSATALASGTPLATLRLFLYESLEKPIEPRVEKTLIQHINAGGAIAWVIAALGALALLLVVLRTLILAAARIQIVTLSSRVLTELRHQRIAEARALCDASSSGAARVLAASIATFGRPIDEADAAVDEPSMRESERLDRFATLITVIAAIAPLLGLLGTVTGMIATFDVITEFGTSDPKLLSGGISEALITTELGLEVAIPALMAGNLLSAWARAIRGTLARTTLAISNLGIANHPHTHD